MKKYIYMLAAIMLPLSIIAQEAIIGTVKNGNGTPIEGVSITPFNSPQHKVITDVNGEFTLNANLGEYVKITYADSESSEIWIDSNKLDIILTDRDITVDNRGESQNSYRQTQAISTVSGDQLSKNSTPDLSNTLYGMLPGLQVRQNTGWTESASFIIRGGGAVSGGTTPIVVVDGIKRSMSTLNVNEIESISVLKDGAATAVWGPEGANGVILVTTKRGAYNTTNIDINYTYGLGLPINQPDFADGYTYATAKNEALYYDGLPAQYSATALTAFKDGSNRNLYANTDWLKEGLRGHSVNNQFDVSFNGGGDKLRYYSLINYKNDYGILNEDVAYSKDEYNTQMKKYELSARVNLDIDATKSTLIKLSMFGLLREHKLPRAGLIDDDDDGDDGEVNEKNIFGALYEVPSAAFPVRNSAGNWASDNTFNMNPIAQLSDEGYHKTNQRLLQSDFRIIQSLSAITEGLSAEAAISYDSSAIFQETAKKEYAYDITTLVLNTETGLMEPSVSSFGENTALTYDGTSKSSGSGIASQYMRTVLEGRVGYNRNFGVHVVNGMLQYRQESYVPSGRNQSKRRQSYMAVAGYNYADKYLLDVVVNRSGTSVLSVNNKFRTYPAVSAGWVLSNEDFLGSKRVNYLKLRASWGLSGNDNMGYDHDEQFWSSQSSYKYYFGDNNNEFNGIAEGILAIRNLTLEESEKYNIGIDAQLFKNLSVSADVFMDKRRKTMVTGSNITSSIIGVDIPELNIGSMNTMGAEISAAWRVNKKDYSYYIGGNFTYLKSEVLENGEGYQPHDYMSEIGHVYGQTFGLEAIGYFNDVADIENSPTQMFSEVRPGDVKYRDQNGDGIINSDDRTAIGHSSSVPGIFYGINLGFEYKGWGVDMVFQGIGKFSRMMTTDNVYRPLSNGGDGNISSWYLEDKIRWTEDTKATANVPRLTTLDNANNYQTSTQWMVDGSYLKLRNLNIYYNLPQKWVKPIGMDRLQIYLRANNLFSIDKVDYMNVEDFSVNYPDMTSVYLGVNINF